MAFALSAFEALLADVTASGREPLGVAAALERLAHVAPGAVAVVRHDVDRLPARAVAMAQLEHGLGICSTYYFRCDRGGSFPEAAIGAIAGMGHEIGYHYETLSAHRGDEPRAVAAFARNLAHLRRIARVATIAQHGAPLSPHDNQRLTTIVDLAAFGLADAATAFHALAPAYLTDTGGRWNAPAALNRRDRLASDAGAVPSPDDRPAFRRFLHDSDRLVYLSAHPERWARGVGRVQAELADMGVNLVKRLLAAGRRGG